MRPVGAQSGAEVDAITTCNEIIRRMDGLYQLGDDMRLTMEDAIINAPAHRGKQLKALDVLDLADMTDEWRKYIKLLPVNESIVWQPQQQALLGCRLKKVILDRDFGTGKTRGNAYV